MKNLLLCTFSTIVCFSVTFGQTVDSLWIIPNPATSDDDVKVVAITSYPGAPCSFINAFTPTQNGNTISFMPIYCYESATGGCTTTDTHSIGQLSAGNYRLSFELLSTNAPGPCGSQQYLLKGIELLDFTVIQGTTGIESEAISIAKIYPNPVSDIVTFSLTSTVPTNSEIKILSAEGKVVKKLILKPDVAEIKQSIDISNLPNGVYFYSINAEKQILSGKLVVAN